MELRKLLAVAALSLAILFGVGVSTDAAASPDYTAFCASLEQSQAQLDTQVADFDASVAAQQAQINAYDAVLGPEYDAVLASYRAALVNGSVAYHAQAALAQSQINMGLALYGC